MPADDEIGFTEKMAADFGSVITVPMDYVYQNRAALRIGRLNPIADEHFREQVAQYFRRYPYDEWYPLSRDEFEEYRKDPTRSASEPFDWQK